MSYETIRYEVRDAVATITLNRPEVYNALNLALGRDLFHAALAADEDPAVRCIVVTGAGKAFCAGGDVKGFANRVHTDTEFPGAVEALARELAQGPTLALGRAKALFHQSTQESLETQMELEAQAIVASGRTEDFRDGVLAFSRKQPAAFNGR